MMRDDDDHSLTRTHACKRHQSSSAPTPPTQSPSLPRPVNQSSEHWLVHRGWLPLVLPASPVYLPSLPPSLPLLCLIVHHSRSVQRGRHISPRKRPVCINVCARASVCKGVSMRITVNFMGRGKNVRKIKRNEQNI